MIKKHSQINHVEETVNINWCVSIVPQYIYTVHNKFSNFLCFASLYAHLLATSNKTRTGSNANEITNLQTRSLRPCYTTTYGTNVCRRMKNSASMLVYAEYVRNKF